MSSDSVLLEFILTFLQLRNKRNIQVCSLGLLLSSPPARLGEMRLAARSTSSITSDTLSLCNLMTSFLHALFWIYRVVGRHLIRHLHAVTLLALSTLPNRLGMVIIVHPDHRAWASTSFRIHRCRAKSSNVSLPVELDTWLVWSAHKAKLRSSIRPLVLYLGHLCGGRVWIFKNPSKIVFHCCKKQKKQNVCFTWKENFFFSHSYTSSQSL